VLPALVAAAPLGHLHPVAAEVCVPVANVWAAPNAGHLPLDPGVWPIPALSCHVALAAAGGLMVESPNSASEVQVVPIRTAGFRRVRRFAAWS
jgi:hypothetical protein